MMDSLEPKCCGEPPDPECRRKESLRDGLEMDLTGTAKQLEANADAPFLAYRRKYVDVATKMGLTPDVESGHLLPMPAIENVKKVIGDLFEEFIRENDIETAVVGVSGDLDSAFALCLLDEIIQERKLKCAIRAFYLKNDFHPERAKRVENLISVLRKNGGNIDFTAFETAAAYDLLQHSVVNSVEGKIRPPSEEFIAGMSSAFAGAVKRTMNGGGQRPSDTHEIADARERSNLIHELLVAMKGYLCRTSDKPAVLVPTTASEVQLDNFTTSDSFGAFPLLVFLPKSVVRHLFVQFLEKHKSEINPAHWEFSLTKQVPYYPDDITITGSDGELYFDRSVRNIHGFGRIGFNPSRSNMPVEIVRKFAMKEAGYASIPGEIQYYVDDFLNYFMFHGCTAEHVRRLCEKFPDRESDIKLAAFMMTAAREKIMKDRYVSRTLP